jgi:integrase
MLPPYATNPFSCFPIEQLRDGTESDDSLKLFTAEQEKSFFGMCDAWQSNIFLMLASYGMRVGELTHLLIENVDFVSGTIDIVSKPELFWMVKTKQRRQLPITPAIEPLLRRCIGERKAGFVFLRKDFASGERQSMRFDDGPAFRQHLKKQLHKSLIEMPDPTDRQKHHAIVRICRRLGQIQTKEVREEFCHITAAIGCPEFTRVHDLRHLFASRAQERGANPLLIMQILGHTTLLMTHRYTHLGMASKRDAIEQFAPQHFQEPSDADRR